DPDPSLMSCRQHSVEVFHGPEIFHDSPVIADVITVVVVRRLVDWRQPYHIDPQFLQIIHFFCDTVKVSDSVPVAVVKTARVYLINHGFFPPCSFHFHFHSPSSMLHLRLWRRPASRPAALFYA